LALFEKDFILKLPGRNMDEAAFIVVREGYYQGFCFLDKEYQVKSVKELISHINIERFDPEANRILNTYLNHQRFEKQLEYY
jgi:hypothetical protein